MIAARMINRGVNVLFTPFLSYFAYRLNDSYRYIVYPAVTLDSVGIVPKVHFVPKVKQCFIPTFQSVFSVLYKESVFLYFSTLLKSPVSPLYKPLPRKLAVFQILPKIHRVG